MRAAVARRLLWASGLAVALPALLVGAEALAAGPDKSTGAPSASAAGSATPSPSQAQPKAKAQAQAPAADITHTTTEVAPSSASIGVLSHSSDLSGHSCTAAVVASSSGEVIVTAAHCVSGTGRGMVFAPGYRSGSAPHGTWVVTGAYAAADWLDGQNPQDDVAFLTVRPASSNSSSATVQSVVGGYPIGPAPRSGTRARVTGYVQGADDAVSCGTTVYWTSGYPSFDCAGFAGGTSGGPWISSGDLTGVIGGLHQGGCSPDTSYSSVFDSGTAKVLSRAQNGGGSDDLPTAGSDGC